MQKRSCTNHLFRFGGENVYQIGVGTCVVTRGGCYLKPAHSSRILQLLDWTVVST